MKEYLNKLGLYICPMYKSCKQSCKHKVAHKYFDECFNLCRSYTTSRHMKSVKKYRLVKKNEEIYRKYIIENL